ncbi:MAG TPA: DUF5011 domain-containing protein, partial [Candidatus Hydrogenedentes bacterium]|nr:DUF5011 domain-containing protein [Candidatus Hydrogenedentota bacterium]
MDKRAVILTVLVALVVLCSPGTARAHDYMVSDYWADYQALANDVQSILDAVYTQYAGCNLWSTSCNAKPAVWSQVVGQSSPSWVGGAAHGANRTSWVYENPGVPDTAHFALLEEVLKPNACLDGIALNTAIAIRNAYNANKALAQSEQLVIRDVWATASVLTCSIDQRVTITTGAQLCVSPGGFVCPIGTTCFDVPPLQSLLDDVNPQFDDMLYNLIAAYMTIGDSRKTDYWYAFSGRLALSFLTDMLAGLLAGIGKSDTPELYAESLPEAVFKGVAYAFSQVELDATGADSKAACAPWGNVPGVDTTVVIPSPVGNINLRIRLEDWRVCNTITEFANKFLCTRYNCSAKQYLATKTNEGDMNQDGTWNIQSWAAAGGNVDQWLVLEGVRLPFYITDQPDPPTGTLTYGDTFTMCVAATSPNAIGYQWYAGPDVNNLSPIQYAGGTCYAAPIDFYSFGPTTVTRVYRVEVSSSCGGNPAPPLWSDPVTVTNTLPPPITITTQPTGGSYLPGQSASLSVAASVEYGGPLQYQWQKETSPGVWTDLSGKTSATLSFTPVTGADAGNYRCRISNQVGSNPVYWTFSNTATIQVAPDIEFTTQPVGGDFNIGDSTTLTVAATVSEGTLSYQWQRNLGFGYQNIPGATGTSLDLLNLTVNDAGSYRCVVTNTHPLGTYSKNSAVAVVNVSSGAVFRVDPTATGTEDGLTWATAYRTIQGAIDAAAAQPNGGEVWVAGGVLGSPRVYNEVRTEAWGAPASVTGSLVMKNNVAVYGGFSGYNNGAGRQETQRRQRNRYQYPTVIDGSVSRAGQPAYHVVVFGRQGAPTINSTLDGFYITGGNASGVPGDYHTWRGGGIYNWQSTPTIANCVIHGNVAEVSGGGIANEAGPAGAANAVIRNCLIVQNTANRGLDSFNNPIRGGAGIFNNQSSPVITFMTNANNTLTDNTTGLFGLGSGGVYNWDGSPIINSSIFAGLPGAVVDEGPLGTTAASVITYTRAGVLYPGVGNITDNPQLDANWMPQPGSPCIDAADPSQMGDDLRGVPRPIDGGVAAVSDMGAYEYSPNGPAPACLNAAIDLAVQTQITDPLVIFDPDNSVIEAGLWYLEVENKTFGCGDIPSSTLQLTAYDTLGRTGTCVATISVSETAAPTAVANPITVYLGGGGTYALTLTDVQTIGAGSSDNCGIDWNASTVAPSTFTCAQAGTAVPVTLTVRDTSGNSATATTTVNVVDNIPPVASCGAITVNLGINGTYTLSAADVQALGAASTDNCGINWGASSVTPNTFSCADLDTPVTVTLNLVDSSGNTASCNTGTVTVHDVTPGVINGVTQQSFVVNAGPYTLAQALSGVTATDGCWGDITASLTVTCRDASNNVVPFPIPDNDPAYQPYPYTFTLTYAATDGSGNVATTSTSLILQNNTPPVITLNGSNPVTVECPNAYTDAGATATDAESGDLTAAIQVSGLPIDTAVPGTYTVTYSVQDPVTLVTVTATRTVNVVDTTAPVITLNGNSTMTIECGSTFTDPGATATDACAGNRTVTVSGSVNANAVGTYTLTYNANDGNGNNATPVTRTVNVVDTTAPVLTLNGSSVMTIQCGSTFTDPGATAVDACTGNRTVNVSGTVNTAVVGTYTRTYTANDGNGNTATTTRTVNVVDTTAPVITLNGSNPVSVQCGTSYTDAGATAVDACTGNRTVTTSGSVNTSVVGTYTITYSANDGNGNTATATRTVNVVDTTAPVITLNGSNPVSVQCGTSYTDAGATATDSCTGNRTVTTSGSVNTSVV